MAIKQGRMREGSKSKWTARGTEGVERPCPLGRLKARLPEGGGVTVDLKERLYCYKKRVSRGGLGKGARKMQGPSVQETPICSTLEFSVHRRKSETMKLERWQQTGMQIIDKNGWALWAKPNLGPEREVKFLLFTERGLFTLNSLCLCFLTCKMRVILMHYYLLLVMFLQELMLFTE